MQSFPRLAFLCGGGPAGSMEGRQVEVAKRILSAKNVPTLPQHRC